MPNGYTRGGSTDGTSAMIGRKRITPKSHATIREIYRPGRAGPIAVRLIRLHVLRAKMKCDDCNTTTIAASVPRYMVNSHDQVAGIATLVTWFMLQMHALEFGYFPTDSHVIILPALEFHTASRKHHLFNAIARKCFDTLLCINT